MEDVHIETKAPRGTASGALDATMATVLHETQTEVAALSQQVRAKDVLIAELRVRLARYEPRADEPVLLAPSAGLVDNLCREIGKLKQKLTETEAQGEKSRAEIQRLQQQLSEQEQEMMALTHRPGHEKDLEIRRLRLVLQDRDRMQATRDVLCTSLTEEVEQLKMQLGATVRVCQGLLRKLEREKQGQESPQGRKFADLVGEPQPSSLESKLKEENQLLKEENQLLKQRVAYVESLNAQWQKYDSSREEYVKALCLKLKEANPQVALGLAPASGGLLQQEITRLNRLLKDKMTDCSRLSRELEDVRREDQERIQMLEQQVLTYVDDFNSERADRERAQSKIQSLQDEVARLQQQLRGQDARDSAAVCQAHSACRPSSRGHTDVAEPLLRSGSSQTGGPRLTAPSAQGSVRTEHRNPKELQCPHCHATYRGDLIDDYMRHFEECDRL